jgi:phosphate:Na+ symporter
MYRRIALPVVLILLAYGFWRSAEFKTVAAGVAVFLFGMMSLEEGFRTFTGGTLERLLKKTTDKLWKSIAFGVVTTSVMQSSSLVSIITISFLSAGMLQLASAIGIIFGANLGTTTGAWLVAGFGLKVNLSAYAMPMLVFGVVFVFQNAKTLKGLGYVLAGLGFLFLGIHFMKEGFETVGQSIDLADYAMTGYAGVLVFTLIGIVATVVMQSSHATLVLILAALAAQHVSYENALALAIGSNVGTTITAIIGALGSGPNGKRLALAHLVFNFVTGLIAILGIYQLMAAVTWLSTHLGIAEDNFTLQLAVFHTLFNVIGIAVMLPLLELLIKVLFRAFPEEEADVEKPRYLTSASMDMADAAVEAARKETVRLYDLSVEVISEGLSIQPDRLGSAIKPKRLVQQSRQVIDSDLDDLYERKIKALYGAIVEFVIHTRGGYAKGALREELGDIRRAGQLIIDAVKAIKHLKKNLVRFIQSDNEVVRKQYDKLRRLVVKVLREIELMREAEPSSGLVLSLDTVKLDVAERAEKIDNALEDLIEKNQIEVRTATSLMNDIAYCRQLCWDLLDAAALLFTDPDQGDMEVMKDISLDDHEIINLAEGAIPESKA